MPQHGITALVDFIEPFEAKKAFTKLAYSQFKSAPLYLEWAPENVFVKSAERTESDKMTIAEESNVNENKIEPKTFVLTREPEHNKKDVKEDDEAELEEPENDTTLFVKNLNFKTTEASLKSVRKYVNSECIILTLYQHNNSIFVYVTAFLCSWQSIQCINCKKKRPQKSWSTSFNGLRLRAIL